MMQAKRILGLFVAMFVVLATISFVAAGSLNVSIDEVRVNDVSGTITLSGSPGESMPIDVRFTAGSDLEDLKVSAWIDGYKSDISSSTSRFDVLAGRTYVKRFSLDLPSVQDLKDLSNDLTLHVRISNKNDDVEAQYSITVQRDSYAYNLLSVEAPNKASAGDIIPVDVVLKNTGARELEDSFVTVSIPELGIQRKAYFGDLTPQDENGGDGKQDARERRVYLVIPSDTLSGNYDLVVKASNYDSSSTAIESITISGLTVGNNQTNTGSTGTNGVGTPTSIIVLTVVLVIIFVVLLIVLIVLLTKRPAEKSEDFGETSYY